MILYVLGFFLTLYGLVGSELLPNGPLVKLPQGLVQGIYKKSYRNKTYSAFEGIPYAMPPVGDLRFKEPQPAVNWKGILKANTHYECLHFMPFILVGARGSEDCLYTYVYVPRETINSNELLDVVVHIHGGGFMMGAPRFMAGPDYLMDRDVIVVSLNYRLGILGFLSTGDSVVPGNNGLKDQTLALKWIKENIKYFGGNPSSITITGISAGAASVHLQYFSSLSKGLFHRGFSQSGTALNCWTIAEESLKKAQAVARNISCPTTSTLDMVECMRKTEAKQLIHGIRTLFVYMDAVPLVLFGPVVEIESEGAFITEQPYKMLQDGNVYDAPWITSNTKDEGLFPVGIIALANKLSEFDEKWYEIMHYALELHYTLRPSEYKKVLSKIKDYYFKGQPITMDNMYSFVDLFTDRMFLVDAEKAIRMQAQTGESEVYYYLFSYLLRMPGFPPGMPKGACHGDDGRLVFKMFMSPNVLPEEDESMVELFLDMLTSFAKTGVPKVKNVEWLPIEPESKSKINVLQISDSNAISMKQLPRLAPNDFWDSLPIQEGADAITSSSYFISAKYFTVVILVAITNCIFW